MVEAWYPAPTFSRRLRPPNPISEAVELRRPSRRELFEEECFGSTQAQVGRTSIGLQVATYATLASFIHACYGNGIEKLARPEGFEPPTLGSEDRCSIR